MQQDAHLTQTELLTAAADALRRITPGNSGEEFLFETAELLNAACGDEVSGILNAFWMKHGKISFGAGLTGALFECSVNCRISPDDLRKQSPDAGFFLDAVLTLFRGLTVLEQYVTNQLRNGGLFPSAAKYFSGIPRFPENRQGRNKAAEMLLAADVFGRGRSFRYSGGFFTPAVFNSVKPPDNFLGYPGARAGFADHFTTFAAGNGNLPLLVNSLPGHGKTSMVLSFAMAHENLTVILADPAALEEGWDALFGALRRRSDRRFVLFFDDIDPRNTDFFNFRTNVGGAFSLPDNILVVMSANYEFPANILSRGRKISFPVFDEIRCQEMVEDFLSGYGIKSANRNLVSQISASYTEEFSQKKFTELSPRSLIRYLDSFHNDMIKRRTIMELASGPMVTRPDAQIFYEFNMALMRALYGSEYVHALAEKRIADIAGG